MRITAAVTETKGARFTLQERELTFYDFDEIERGPTMPRQGRL